ncbi:response regulator transcription factor [Pseudoalteromonas sp. SG41-1]|uniref:Response regulator transcription factor n=2 Tax=Pseudoalteromonas TaxID=53246 RepID=A0ABY3F9K8_9GAMM|nr:MULTISPECIES: response regulator transcription factor [Pseudoalteromonas]MBB1300769.1 response regulator transcription factor [Pseudoalteromonas sp. SR44-8]MBB1505661.1 response regulator transcription factor [Pseudoalteromonas sp. SG41-1]TVU80443.1 response regulator transcription factor [Pseudoalteromonas neustonica]
MNILLADDELPLLNFLSRGLRSEGYECTSINELHEVLPFIKKNSPQIVILDRLFGSQDSLSILEAVKALPNPPMVLMLTALDEVPERVKGLEMGADDYLCKPFDFDELLARVLALKRRMTAPQQQDQTTLNIGSLALLIQQRIALLNGEELALTKIEFELLLYFVENQDKVLSRERILSRVWQTYSEPNTNIIDVYVSRLRKKIETEPNLTIQTLRGNGYRMNLK